MLDELLKEEALVLSDFNSFLNNSPEIEIKTASDSTYEIKKLLSNLIKRSQIALEECQLIESLDKQLKLLSETQTNLNNLNNLNRLNAEILSHQNSTDLAKLIPLILEWKKLGADVKSLSANYEAVATFITERVPEIINEEISLILKGWTDSSESRDIETLKLLQLRPDSINPLHALFASYPLQKLSSLLEYHRILGKRKDQFPDLLLNRFYDILQGDMKGSAFSVGQIEVLVPEKMKFATRISCILEASSNFIKLHPDFKDILLLKCAQIVKQIRKQAQEERAGYSITIDTPPAVLDSQLNEISLIISTIREFLVNYPEIELLSTEHEKWIKIYNRLEEFYIYKGISRAIEMDQIVSSEVSNTEFPVSSCVDDIFYVLQAAKNRSSQINHDPKDYEIIAKSFKEYFLNVLKRHLETSLQTIKPLNLMTLEGTFRPTRELISFLVLINNLISTRVNWQRAFASSSASNTISDDLEKLFNFALKDGFHPKVLQSSIKKELQDFKTGEDLFIKIHSILLKTFNLFKNILAKEALNEEFQLILSDFSQIFCKQLYDDPSLSSTTILRYDRLLHELSQFLDSHLSMSSETCSMIRVKQSISLLMAENKSEGQEIVEEWKKDNSCTLRAGEILLIMNKIEQMNK